MLFFLSFYFLLLYHCHAFPLLAVEIDYILIFIFTQTLLHEGGTIPKSLYKSLSDEEGMGSPTHDGNHIYQSVDLKPGQIQEVIIKNNDPHSILTWDFDVVRSNLKFTVYRTSRAILSTVSGECYSQ